MQQTKNKAATPRQAAFQKFNNARSNLLLMLAFTAINIILFVAGTETMFLFSATVPYLAVTFGILLENSALLTGAVVLAVLCLAMYLLCWILSKKHYIWMIVAAAMFAVDTLVMVGVYLLAGEISGIMDFLIHIWVMYYLIVGAVSGYKLKTLPPDQPMEAAFTELTPEGAVPPVQSAVAPRLADSEVKARVLLEEEVFGHQVCYRRVKRVNELVIDGYVYDDVEMLVETAHALNATVDGHQIQVGFDGMSHSYLRVDGQQVSRKMRLF